MGYTQNVATEREDLSNKLQEIINENPSTPFLLNPYFRIQKNDDESHKKYTSLRYDKVSKNIKLKVICQAPQIAIKIISFYVGSLLYVKQIKCFKTNDLKTETLFISHATKSNTNDEKELFFGNLPTLFSKRNCTVLYLNQTRSKYSKVLTKLVNKQISRNVILMPKFLYPSETKEYLAAVAKLLKDHLKLANAYKEQETIKANILLASIPWIFSRETYNNFNLLKRTIDLQRTNQVKNVFLTLEGYNYEEILATKLTSENKKINLFFYQHSPLTKAHIGVQFFLKNFNKKICILTTGTAYSKFLLGLSSRNETICIGSTKVMKPVENSKKKNTSILVVPEGTTAQTDKFLQFTSRVAKVYPNVLFIFRFHPNLVIKGKTKKLKRDLGHLSNVEISLGSLSRDISRTKATMYTGSVVAIEALNSKNLPIFVNFDDNLELDVFSVGSFNYPHINPLNFEQELFFVLMKINDLNSYNFDTEALYRKFQIPKKLANLFNA
jgi:hypothetical protein